MRKNIEKLRELIDQIAKECPSEEDRQFVSNFDALEVPGLVAQIVDYLQPLLTTYEAAIYWYMFRRSVLQSGDQYARVSVRGMGSGVVLSSSGQSDELSYGVIQKTLQGLEDKGAISKVGEPNREGTPYKVHLPEEIEACRKAMESHVATEISEVDAATDLDYYNVKENRLKVFERDEYKCHYCGKQLTRFTATLDHLQPVSEGGDHSIGNLTTACLHCNSSRGAQPLSEFLPKTST